MATSETLTAHSREQLGSRNARALRRDGRIQCHVQAHDDEAHLNIHTRYKCLEIISEGFSFAAGLKHLPVTADQRLTHILFSLTVKRRDSRQCITLKQFKTCPAAS